MTDAPPTTGRHHVANFRTDTERTREFDEDADADDAAEQAKRGDE